MVEVIESSRRCREIVEILKSYDVISVDAEGVNLGKEGPLTLLQIGTTDAKVYLFDVLTNKRLFEDGQLKSLLQSPQIVKVMHSCRGDSAALFFQFDVHLQNVFDSQIAHLVIEEHKGQKIPRTFKLSEICSQYSEHSKVSDEKDVVKEKFIKKVGDLWAKRPLTEEMIAYAAGDVTALIPEVYETQKAYLKKNQLMSLFNDRVQEEKDFFIDETLKKQREERQDEVIRKVLSSIPSKYNSSVSFKDISDLDDIRAINLTRFEDANFHPMVSRLKTEAIKVQLQELDDQLSDEGDKFIPRSRSYGFLHRFQRHPDENIQQSSTRILNSINAIVLDDMTRKYNLNTTLAMIDFYEKDALKTLRPKGVNDPTFHPVHLHLYWLVKESDLDSTIARLQDEGRAYKITEGFYKWLKFCCSGNVPQTMKQKAKKHLQKMDFMFGKGVVPKAQ